MKIAITGHTAGIGQALSNVLQSRGHEIIGISKRDGYNIRVTPKITKIIDPCDLFINNAQAGYAQTELLFSVWEQWKDQSNKHIWCISTMMTTNPTTDADRISYRNQKIALEDACYQLSSKCHYPSISLIRPGQVATQPEQTPGGSWADVNTWASILIQTIISAETQHLRIKEISLSSTTTGLKL